MVGWMDGQADGRPELPTCLAEMGKRRTDKLEGKGQIRKRVVLKYFAALARSRMGFSLLSVFSTRRATRSHRFFLLDLVATVSRA